MRTWIAGCFFLILLFCSVLVPPVWLLQNSVSVERWDAFRGQEWVEVGPAKNQWLPLKEASRHALWAVVVAEDARFYQHQGLDWREIWESFQLNWSEGRIVRGGSTITQQVVKLALVGREKSFLRKIREAIGAILTEKILTKDEILAWYINLVDFGSGIYGLGSAAHHYFKTPAMFLTVSQAVNLAVVLPSPNRRSKGLRERALSSNGKQRFVRVLDELVANRYITVAQRNEALRTGDFGNPIHMVEGS
ncbi:MAG: transglycosylase domain-containing protein [Oligoflexales bacterium]